MPSKFAIGIEVFPFKGIGKINCAEAFGEVTIMLRFYLPEMKTEWFEQNFGEHGDAVILPFSITNNNLAVCKIEVFNAKP